MQLKPQAVVAASGASGVLNPVCPAASSRAARHASLRRYLASAWQVQCASSGKFNCSPPHPPPKKGKGKKRASARALSRNAAATAAGLSSSPNLSALRARYGAAACLAGGSAAAQGARPGSQAMPSAMILAQSLGWLWWLLRRWLHIQRRLMAMPLQQRFAVDVRPRLL